MKGKYRWTAFLLITVLLAAGCGTSQTAMIKNAAENPVSEKTVMAETITGNAVTEDPAGIPADIDQLASSVVKLEVYDSHRNKISTGTGFAYGDPAKLVTSAHVVVNMDYMEAETDPGDTFRIEDPAVFLDEDLDIAMFEIPGKVGLPSVNLAESLPPRGTSVVTIGSQAGMTNLLTTGVVSGTWEDGGKKYILFTAPVSGGNSGGPVFDQKGNLVGVVIGTYEKGQNLNIALYAGELPSAE